MEGHFPITIYLMKHPLFPKYTIYATLSLFETNGYFDACTPEITPAWP